MQMTADELHWSILMKVKEKSQNGTFLPRPPPRLSLSFLEGFLDAVGAPRPRSGGLASDLREFEGFRAAGFETACSSLLTGLGAGLTFLKMLLMCQFSADKCLPGFFREVGKGRCILGRRGTDFLGVIGL